ncbi:MAG: glycosyltransferase, partial [Paludibacteraceae bacterium]|nr:glycosyltransferase [Paludibacteraceae bacterium]
MKRILYITAFPPNECTGGQMFSKCAIQDLARSHRVDVWYFAYPGHACDVVVQGNVGDVRQWEAKRFSWLRYLWVYPIFSRRMNGRFLRELKRVALSYDILYFDFSQVALASLFVSHPCKIIRMHDVLCQKFDRTNSLVSKWIRKTEEQIVRSAKKVFVPSEKDVRLLLENYGVTAEYTHEYLKPFVIDEPVVPTNQVALYGYWKRPENADGLRWFLQRVIPLSNKKWHFVTIGGGMSESLRAEAEQAGVHCLGFVDDPLPELFKSAALVVPLFRGAGVKVKALDALSTGTYVVGTHVALEGLP